MTLRSGTKKREKTTDYTFEDVKKVIGEADIAVASYRKHKRISVELALLRDTHQTYIFEYFDLLESESFQSSGNPETEKPSQNRRNCEKPQPSKSGPYLLLSKAIHEEQVTVDAHNKNYLQKTGSHHMIQPFEQNPKNTDAYPIRSAAEKANLAYDIPNNEFGICVDSTPPKKA